jgi:hypothetical protein
VYALVSQYKVIQKVGIKTDDSYTHTGLKVVITTFESFEGKNSN